MIYPIIHAERDFRFHEKIKTAFSIHPEFQFIDHVCYTDAALPLLTTRRPAILLTASKLYDDADCVQTLCAFRDQHMPDLKVIVLTSKDNMDHFLNSVVAGVDGYISKCSTTEEIYQCINSVISGDNYLGIQKDVIKHK